MDIREILSQFQSGNLNIGQAEEQLGRILRSSPFEDLGYAMVDHHRAVRQGVPEVIYGAGKTPEQTAGIVRSMIERGCENILVTRITHGHYEAVQKVDPSAEYHEIARIIVAAPAHKPKSGQGEVLILAAGTSDLPVCEEAAVTAEVLGARVGRLYDVGVAGIHRLLLNSGRVMSANVLVVVAGMEGALPSVVAGMVDRPVIAVPTSVGYGANFGGLSALLTMINSCASGVSVVNIDNGFGAGYLAALIDRPPRISE